MEGFKDIEILPAALKNKFRKMTKDILKGAGVSANLSGLSEELVSIILTLEEERFNQANA